MTYVIYLLWKCTTLNLLKFVLAGCGRLKITNLYLRLFTLHGTPQQMLDQ